VSRNKTTSETKRQGRASPQAKGRIERLFETLQDRLVKEMRLAGIDNLAAANHFLEMRFLPAWEERFTVAPRRPRNAHRRLDPEQRLEEILSVRVARQVADDHTVSWDGTRWGVPREEVCAGLRGAQVEIERRLDGSHWLRFRGRYLRLRHCPAPLRPSASPSGLRPPGLAERTARPKNKIKPKYHVPAHHPREETVEPDISILRKTGHFYFALTRSRRHRSRRTGQPSFWLFELALFGLASGTFVLTPRPRRAENKNPQSGCFAGK
jgi:hypothetical protein